MSSMRGVEFGPKHLSGFPASTVSLPQPPPQHAIDLRRDLGAGESAIAVSHQPRVVVGVFVADVRDHGEAQRFPVEFLRCR